MDRLWNKMKNILKCWSCLLILSFVMLWVSYGVDDLLRQAMDPVMKANSFIDMWENVNTVWWNFFEWSYRFDPLQAIEDIISWDDFNLGNVLLTGDNKPLCGWFWEWKDCPSECSQLKEELKGKCRKEWRWKFIESDKLPLGITREPSTFVKVARLLLSLTIALSVTMILYNWMKYIIQTWQWKEWKDLVKNIVYIVIWILIGLFSLIIISIIQSVPNTIEKDIKTSDIETDKTLIQYK